MLLTKVNSYTKTLQQLNEWKNNGLVILKPTLSSKHIIVFWVHDSILSKTLRLTGVRGGFKLSSSKSRDRSLANNQNTIKTLIALNEFC